MRPEDIQMIRRCMPDTLAFPYYADRESPWLVARQIRGDARVADLRRGPLAKFLDRPLLRAIAARSGDGVLRRADLDAAADAHMAEWVAGVGPAGWAAVGMAFGEVWRDYEVTFEGWGAGDPDWRWRQLSRPGGNLVVQLGFPADHGALFGRYLPDSDRRRFESWDHPVRQTGRPTLAWARLDVEIDAGVALIEEIQSDWIRMADWQLAALARRRPKSRELRNMQGYHAGLVARYGREWPKAMMLAALVVLRDELGIGTVFLHTARTGNVLKDCDAPRSLYSGLPKSFGFQPTREVPEFLLKPRRRHLGKLRKSGAPLFWRLAFDH